MGNDVWEEAREWFRAERVDFDDRKAAEEDYDVGCLVIENLLAWKEAHDKQPVVEVFSHYHKIPVKDGRVATVTNSGLYLEGRYRKEVK